VGYHHVWGEQLRMVSEFLKKKFVILGPYEGIYCFKINLGVYVYNLRYSPLNIVRRRVQLHFRKKNFTMFNRTVRLPYRKDDEVRLLVLLDDAGQLLVQLHVDLLRVH